MSEVDMQLSGNEQKLLKISKTGLSKPTHFTHLTEVLISKHHSCIDKQSNFMSKVQGFITKP